MTAKQSQFVQIADFIKTHGSITNRQAFAMGIGSLSRRIKDMKEMGFSINTEYTAKRFAVYTFGEWKRCSCSGAVS